MVRRGIFFASLIVALAGCKAQGPRAVQGEKLEGYTVMDIATRRAQRRDLWVVDGKIATQAPAGSEHWPVRHGQGKWLLPSYWDLLTASWGNPSTQDYRTLFQSMGSDTLAKAQLSVGVGHVVAGLGNGGWYQGGLKRDRAMELFGAECLRSSRYLCGPAQDTPGGVTLGAVADVEAPLAKELAQDPQYILVSYSHGTAAFPAVSKAVLVELIHRGHQAGKKVVVNAGLVGEAQEAVGLGADALVGPPFDRDAKALFSRMAQAKVAWGPFIAATLDLHHLGGPEGVLSDPLAAGLIRRDLMDDYLSAGKWGAQAARQFKWSEGKEDGLLLQLRQAKAAGVVLLAPTFAGWAAGSFQGLSLHRNLRWMVKAGLSPWDALEAVTLAPARLLGRPCDLEDGAPADFVVLDADPIADIKNAARISELHRGARWGKPQDLKPDLWRRHY